MICMVEISVYNTPWPNLYPHLQYSSGRWFPSSWLRPVVGTFEAVGIGEDLHDNSYEDRGFSLDSTHTFLK
jgi:hypothetical protein